MTGKEAVRKLVFSVGGFFLAYYGNENGWGIWSLFIAFVAGFNLAISEEQMEKAMEELSKPPRCNLHEPKERRSDHDAGHGS
jgi:hypothetical protein